MTLFPFLLLRRDRRGATAVVFAVIFVAVLMAVGLTVDFAAFMLARTNLSLAADAAVLAGVTTSANAILIPGTSSAYNTVGVNAALTRFNGQAGMVASASMAGKITLTSAPAVVLAVNGNTLTGQLSWTAAYSPYFASLFRVPSWPLSGTSVAAVPVALYLNVEVLLDNSGSMEIAAGPNDINTLQVLTACSAAAPSAGQGYGSYGCEFGSWSYNNPPLTDSNGNYVTMPTCPIPQTNLGGANGITYPQYPDPDAGGGAPTCPSGSGLAGQQAQGPCAFACHWNTGSSYSSSNPSDYFWLARSTLGSGYGVTLRFDLVKTAVNELITTMQADNLTSISDGEGNLKIGIFTFADYSPQRVYPANGEAGAVNAAGATAAIAAVGVPPDINVAYPGQEQGIQPYVGANGGETNFDYAMSQLGGMLTASGDGTSAATPKKVLFIVTDGLQDPSNRDIQAFPPGDCSYFKTPVSQGGLGYTVYVLYTPYYSLMNTWYFSGTWPTVASIVQALPSASNSIAYNLQQCSTYNQQSNTYDYFAATDSTGISAALQSFLTMALTSRAKLTQ